VATRRVPGPEGVEALLARTKRQITRTIFAATALVVLVVGVGGALASSSALDRGLDAALQARATRIVLELQEHLPPYVPLSPSPEASETPDESPSGSPDDQSPAPSESPSSSGGDVPMPSGGGDDDDGEESDDGESGLAPMHAQLAVAWHTSAVGNLPAADAPPTVPPGIGDEQTGAGGPWAVLAPNGAILAGAWPVGEDFPILAGLEAAERGARTETYLIGGAEYRVVTMPLSHPNDPTHRALAYVQVAARVDVRDAQRQSLYGSLLLVGALAIGTAVLVALTISRRVLAPISAAAARERAMVASASHELRTPASVILSSAEILEREGLVKPAGRDLVRGIVAESERLGRLSADLHTLSREGARDGSSPVASVTLEPIDLAAVARDAFDRADAIARRAGMSLERDIADRAIPVLGDTDRLIQLVLGLVENAIRHSPKGGSITIGARSTEGVAEIWVDDQGSGIPDEEREKIFEPFYRGGRRRAAGDGGSGLGLAIARAITAAHNGSIGAESAPGGGARLVMRLSVREE
jgi:signal transduction histidine kinase